MKIDDPEDGISFRSKRKLHAQKGARRPQHPELIRVQPEHNDRILPGQHTAPQRQPQPHALPLEQRVHHTLPGLHLNSEFKNTGTKEKVEPQQLNDCIS
ncbi:hypothetical protein J1605_017642 [Eschrichtius robustus]|uniref:Uncharacterized protein n=1 Tax=Eschrichtius robustus TaxID=9764 RepID=A0AB34I1G7_ESCRO|nr:hypothetical protein J1605_017642 [Eschrichtius robustus]